MVTIQRIVKGCWKIKERIRQLEDFPHEIGLFLSYPIEDVLGFIENRGKNYILNGYWKVYGNEEEARKSFFKYRKCTDVYHKLLWEEHPLKSSSEQQLINKVVLI